MFLVFFFQANHCAVASYSQASHTGRWLDADALEVKCSCWTVSSL